MDIEWSHSRWILECFEVTDDQRFDTIHQLNSLHSELIRCQLVRELNAHVSNPVPKSNAAQIRDFRVK